MHKEYCAFYLQDLKRRKRDVFKELKKKASSHLLGRMILNFGVSDVPHDQIHITLELRVHL